MRVEITQVIMTKPSQQYPWTHRIQWKDLRLHELTDIMCWTENDAIPGQWVSGSAYSAFYTTEDVATYVALKWS